MPFAVAEGSCSGTVRMARLEQWSYLIGLDHIDLLLLGPSGSLKKVCRTHVLLWTLAGTSMCKQGGFLPSLRRPPAIFGHMAIHANAVHHACMRCTEP